MDALPDKLIGRMVATLPQFQPYHHPFQPTTFHSTFPQPYQQPAPHQMTTAVVAIEKVESEESKVNSLDIKHKAIWDTLVQMDPNPSMVQYHKSFKKGYLELLVFHQKKMYPLLLFDALHLALLYPSYLKFPYLKHLGREKGWNRVGPLARMNVCEGISTPLAAFERLSFLNATRGKTNNASMYSHWARLIELLHCAELMKDLLEDDDILGNDLVRRGIRRSEGVGIIEAPRGTLIHHYQVDEKDRITRCNLIVSTTHNNEAMNQAVRWVANEVIDGTQKVSEGMLNQVEVAIRAYDPCLSCATHAMGQMPLEISLYDHLGNLTDVKRRD